MYFVYVLISEKQGRHYVGLTNDIYRRLEEHNKGKTKSTRFYSPWRILFKENYKSRIEARNREKYLKSGVGREFIKKWSSSSVG